MYLCTGLWPCPTTGMAVGFLRTMSHRMCRRNTERTSGRHLSNSRRCICTVEPSRIDQLRTSAPFQTRRGHQGFALRCTSQVSHGAGGHQGPAWSTPQSRAHVSPMFSMQHHPVMQRALPPCTKSADSPHTPAASPQGRHRDVAPLHRTRVHLHCHLPIPAISPITPSVGILDASARSPLLQVRALAPCCTRRAQRCSTPSPAVLASHNLALCSVTVPHSDTASRLLLVLPHTARRTRNTFCVPLPGCCLRTRLRPRTPPPHPPSPPPLALCFPLGVPVRVRHHHIPLHFQPCPCPPLGNLHLSAPFLLSSCLSHPLLTILQLRRPPASASPHPIRPSLRTPLAPGP